MVEAAIYFPITIALVMAILYYGLFKMQECMLYYEVERTATSLAKEMSYPGYDSFGVTDKKSNSVDFDWGDEAQPSSDQVASYYAAYNQKLSDIYRWGAGADTGKFDNWLQQLNKKNALFSFTKATTDINVSQGLLSNSVKVTFSIKVATPGILQYIGMKDSVMIQSSSYATAANTTDFVRNTDFAVDMVRGIASKLNIDVDKFIENYNKIIEFI